MKTVENMIDKEKDSSLSNDVLKVIYERRAVRKYKETSVSENLIQVLLDAARMAPSAINKQPWSFYVLSNKTVIQNFSKEISKAAVKGILKSGLRQIIKSGKDLLHFSNQVDLSHTEDHIFYNAPVVIFITAPKDNEWASLDIGMCSQNLMLAAKSLGLDTCPIGLAKFVEHTTIYSLLKVPDTEQVKLAIVVGYGDESPVAKERNRENVHFYEDDSVNE